jgi:outer membrane protein W
LIASASEPNLIGADVARAQGISRIPANVQVSGVTGRSPVEGIAKDVKETVEGVPRSIAFFFQQNAPLEVLLVTPFDHIFETTTSSGAIGNGVLKI